MKIRLLSNKAIDRNRYDAVLEQSLNGRIYARSWYLDLVSPGWKLLTTDDYQYVMPLPCKRKWGISYLIQPPLCQQLGVFSSVLIDSQTMKLFLQSIPYKYYVLKMNSGNPPVGDSMMCPNYLLPLSKNYEEIRESYLRSCLNGLKTAETKNVRLEMNLTLDEFLFFLKTNSTHYIHLIELMRKILSDEAIQNHFDLCGAYTETGELSAVALFLKWKNRIYYLAAATSKESRTKNGNRLILDGIIRKYAGTDMLLDFEGSSIPTIADFFKSFGAYPESYPLLFENRFPWPLNTILNWKYHS